MIIISCDDGGCRCILARDCARAWWGVNVSYMEIMRFHHVASLPQKSALALSLGKPSGLVLLVINEFVITIGRFQSLCFFFFPLPMA